MEITTTIILIVLGAAVGEGINEFFFLPWLDLAKGKLNEVTRIQLARLWSGVVGVVLAFELALDVFALLGAAIRHEWVGYVLTGLLIGRGSNYVHDLLKRYITQPEQFTY